MAKIDRYDGNVEAFASQATTNKRTTFGTTNTGDDTLDGNVTPDFLTGWEFVGPSDEPTLQDFNALAFTISQFLSYLHQAGVPEWNGSQEYQSGSYANRGGVLYVCQTADHVSATPPESDATNWYNFSNSQFQNYSSSRTYTTVEVVRGSDGVFYEFYDRDQAGSVQGVDPTNAANRPHIWMEWDGVKPGATIEWRSESLPEGYVENDGAEISRADYRRIFAAHGTTYGAGDGSTTFLLPDDRGEFKRGLDRGKGVDPGRSIGDQQIGTLQFVMQPNDDAVRGIRSNNGFSQDFGADPAALSDYSAEAFRVDDGGSVQTTSGTAGQTRPRNNAVIYLTKI